MDLLSSMYLATGVAFTIAFLPQIRTLWKDTTGAASTNIASWGMFAACSMITVLYAAQANGDPYFVATAALGALGNMTVFGLAVLRRTQARVRQKA